MPANPLFEIRGNDVFTQISIILLRACVRRAQYAPEMKNRRRSFLQSARLLSSPVIAFVLLGSMTDLPATASTFSNSRPSAAFIELCSVVAPTTTQLAGCDQRAVKEIDHGRQLEGVGPMNLPRGYDQLSLVSQILVITNLERVDRGLAPVAGVNARIDDLAQRAAVFHTDPVFPTPFPGTSGGSNWASVWNPLLADFLFMYDDGPGGINIDCSRATTAGCWGHRRNILATYQGPIIMGAAVVGEGGGRTSLTQEFIGGDTTDSVNVSSWSSELSNLDIGLSTHSLTLVGHSTSVVSVWASGRSNKVTAHLTSTTSGWFLPPTTCVLRPGHTCQIKLRFTPPPKGPLTTTLVVNATNGETTITLVGKRSVRSTSSFTTGWRRLTR